MEKDYTNTFLITNPLAIFRVFSKDQFLSLPEATQCTLLDRMDDILIKCSHNSLILTDHIVQASTNHIIRVSQTAIFRLKNSKGSSRSSSLEENKTPKVGEINKVSGSPTRSTSASLASAYADQDFLHLVIHLALKLSNKKSQSSKKLVELIRRLT